MTEAQIKITKHNRARANNTESQQSELDQNESTETQIRQKKKKNQNMTGFIVFKRESFTLTILYNKNSINIQHTP